MEVELLLGVFCRDRVRSSALPWAKGQVEPLLQLPCSKKWQKSILKGARSAELDTLGLLLLPFAALFFSFATKT